MRSVRLALQLRIAVSIDHGCGASPMGYGWLLVKED